MWQFETEGKVKSSPIVAKGAVYFFGSFDGHLYALDGQTGQEIWKFKTKNYVYSSPIIGSDGIIYVGSNDGNIYSLNPNGTLKWKYKVSRTIE